MATLNDDEKRLIVMRLACFVSSAEIQAELREIGTEVTLPQISYYNPELRSSEDVGAAWRTLHAETRAAFIRDTASIPVAHKSYRLRELDDMVRRAKKVKNFALAGQLLEQAAKEMGESYTNRRVIEAADPAAALANMLGLGVDDINAAVATIDATGAATTTGTADAHRDETEA